MIKEKKEKVKKILKIILFVLLVSVGIALGIVLKRLYPASSMYKWMPWVYYAAAIGLAVAVYILKPNPYVCYVTHAQEDAVYAPLITSFLGNTLGVSRCTFRIITYDGVWSGEAYWAKMLKEANSYKGVFFADVESEHSRSPRYEKERQAWIAVIEKCKREHRNLWFHIGADGTITVDDWLQEKAAGNRPYGEGMRAVLTTDETYEKLLGVNTLEGIERAVARKRASLDTSDTLQFLAASSKKVEAGHYAEIDVYAYAVEEAAKAMSAIEEEFDKGRVNTKKSGLFDVQYNTRLTFVLESDDIPVDCGPEELVWRGRYGKVNFIVMVPEDYIKPQILFHTRVYADGAPLCRLSFTIGLKSNKQKAAAETERFLKAFISYASADRDKVWARLQGMRIANPRLDLFMDVLSLRSGEDWEMRLFQEIALADIFFLFWSRNAMKSDWVEKEWRSALAQKGDKFIEPVPLEPPNVAPVPPELAGKHFNDLLLMMNPESRGTYAST